MPLLIAAVFLFIAGIATVICLILDRFEEKAWIILDDSPDWEGIFSAVFCFCLSAFYVYVYFNLAEPPTH